MTTDPAPVVQATTRRADWIAAARLGPLAPYLQGSPWLEVGPAEIGAGDEAYATVCAPFRLEEARDYRAALQAWFRAVRIDGHLVVAVPHAFLHERQLALPSRWIARQRRLYTPGSLMEEVEEALVPNTYRVRHLGDLDQGYDYGLDCDQPPVGRSDVVLVLQKITPPSWKLALVPEERPAKPRPDAPDYQFEPPRTRIEVQAPVSSRRVLILKLDHLGDFIMGIAALERARELFRGAEITLVVGSWNAELARSLGVADRVIAFDAFPRNSSEEEVDVPGKAALFQATITGEYDLAIDLRTDADTRPLLRLAKAALRAGLGSRSRFSFLDIFLPLDSSHSEAESAREFLYDHRAFLGQGAARRTEHRLVSSAATVERDCAIIWGPYRELRAGRYIFEPALDIEPGRPGLLKLDIALDAQRVAQTLLDGPGPVRLPFSVETDGASFEFSHLDGGRCQRAGLQLLRRSPHPGGGRCGAAPVGAPLAARRGHRPAAGPDGGPGRDGCAVSDIVIAPFSNSDIRDWPLEHFRDLIGLLLAESSDRRVTVIGTASQRLRANEVVRPWPAGRVINACGRLSWPAVLDLIKASACVISNNSGIGHLSGYLGLPTVCIFGGSHQRHEWRPLGDRVALVSRAIGCSPCQLDHVSGSPYGKACLRQIAPAEVAGAASAIMQRAADSGATSGATSGAHPSRLGMDPPPTRSRCSE